MKTLYKLLENVIWNVSATVTQSIGGRVGEYDRSP